MHYVYILKSQKDEKKFYIGETNDIERRLKEHNSGLSLYTKRYLPWEIETYIAFTDAMLAKSFEKYLKSGSGKVFLKRRLMSSS